MSRKPRLNIYTCQSSCNAWIVTLDKEDGVTPMFIPCRKCNGRMVSSSYKVPEWVREEHAEAFWTREIPEDQHGPSADHHREMGGLFLHYPNHQPVSHRGTYLGMKRFKNLRRVAR